VIGGIRIENDEMDRFCEDFLVKVCDGGVYRWLWRFEVVVYGSYGGDVVVEGGGEKLLEVEDEVS
jgi:hypothetical protein